MNRLARKKASVGWKKVKHFPIQSFKQPQLMVKKTIMKQYIQKLKATDMAKMIVKKSRTDSNTDPESSIASTQSINESYCQKVSVAINTEDKSSNFVGKNNLWWVTPPYSQVQCQELSLMKYFMFPTYGLLEKATQTIEQPNIEEMKNPKIGERTRQFYLQHDLKRGLSMNEKKGESLGINMILKEDVLNR